MSPRTTRPTALSPARGRGRPRDEQAEQAIIHATITLLDQRGFAGLSIEGVARLAGVSRPTVYRRWPTKLDLAVDAVLRTAPPLDVTETGDPKADLQHVVSKVVTEFTSSPFGRVVAAAFLSHNPEARPLARRLREEDIRRGRAVIIGMLQRAVEQGILREDLDTDLLLDLMLGVPIYRWVTSGQPADPASTRAAIDLIWQAALRVP